MTFTTIEEVRNRIDQLDRELVNVIDRVRRQAAEAGLSEVIIEKIYRTMISAFIEYELEQHDQLRHTAAKTD